MLKQAVQKFTIEYNRLRHGVPNRYLRLYELVQEHRPLTIVEIGVWNGDRAKELIAHAAAARPSSSIRYFGFDLFETASEEKLQSELAKQPLAAKDVAAFLKRSSSSWHQITLVAGDTRETLRSAVPTIASADFVFIDGGHSYETVKNDWTQIQPLLHSASVVVFDDIVDESSLRHEAWGVNRLVEEISWHGFQVSLLTPIDWWPKPYGFLKNRLALVQPPAATHALQMN